MRILVIDRGMSPLRAGMFVQQLLELETYRTFCLLGLPEAQRLQPVVRRIEQSLGEITAEMTTSEGLAANKALRSSSRRWILPSMAWSPRFVAVTTRAL